MIGTRVPRIDIPQIVSGRATFVQNVRVPGMLHGRVVRPRGQGAVDQGAKLLSVDKDSIKHIEGAQVVVINNFVGVVAPKEYAAIQAAAQLEGEVGRDAEALGQRQPRLGAEGSGEPAPATRIAAQSGNIGAGLARRDEGALAELLHRLPGPRADRPERRRSRTSAATRRRCSAWRRARTRRAPRSPAR